MMSGHSHDVVEPEGRRGEHFPEEDRLASRISDPVRRALQDLVRGPDALRQAILSGQHEHPSSHRTASGLDPAAVTARLTAGGIGFGVAWLIFGQHWHRTDNVARRMRHSSERMA